MKLNQSLFYLLLCFPLFHFWSKCETLMKPLLILFVGLVSLVLFKKLKMLFRDTFTIIVSITFIMLLLLQLFYNWEIDISPYIFLLSLFLFYKICFCLLQFNTQLKQNYLIFKTYVILISLEIVFFLLSDTFIFSSFQPNNSIFSILLAAQLIFILPSFDNFIKSYKAQNILLFSFILLTYSLLLYTKGRAGILGFSIALIIFKYDYIRSKIGNLKIVIIGTCILLALINFKNDSSSGRLLIYKVVLTQLEPKELITGIGYGKFKTRYNQLQAKYFSENSINSKEALLADNIGYMYNDPLQLIIETGLTGIVFILFIIIKLLLILKNNENLIQKSPNLKGASLSILCVLISSFFMYPFQITCILLHLLFCVTLIIQATYIEKKPFLSSQKIPSIICKTSLLLTSGSLLFFGCKSFEFYLKSEQASLYANKGLRQKSIKAYDNLSHSFIKDGYVLYNYSNELIKINKIDSALIILQKANNYVYDSNSTELMGNLLYEKNNFTEAEKYYKQSVFMNPKLFNSRLSLFKFYCKTKQFEKASFWGKSILKMPVKIPSENVNSIKKETEKLLSDPNFK